MSIKVLGIPKVYIVQYIDRYNGEKEIVRCFTSAKQAQSYVRIHNKDIKETYDDDCFTEDFDVDWGKINDDSRYYYIVSMMLTM